MQFLSISLELGAGDFSEFTGAIYIIISLRYRKPKPVGHFQVVLIQIFPQLE